MTQLNKALSHGSAAFVSLMPLAQSHGIIFRCDNSSESLFLGRFWNRLLRVGTFFFFILETVILQQFICMVISSLHYSKRFLFIYTQTYTRMYGYEHKLNNTYSKVILLSLDISLIIDPTFHLVSVGILNNTYKPISKQFSISH